MSTDVEIISQACTSVFEHLTIKCHLFYSPREFPCALLTAVYFPPQDKAGIALEKLYKLYTAVSGFEDQRLNHC